MSYYLDKHTYSDVERDLFFGYDPSAPCGARSFNTFDGDSYIAYEDRSFGRQIAEVLEPGKIDPELAGAPEIYLVTALSAVPLADGIRGYYEGLGRSAPPIMPIYANSHVSRIYLDGDNSNFETEVRRLSEFMAGVEHPCIVDEYVSSGSTLKYAMEAIKAVGVKNGSVIKGQWYQQVIPADIDLLAVTSIHAPFMREMGLLAVNRSN